jgi:hypothetical protein
VRYGQRHAVLHLIDAIKATVDARDGCDMVGCYCPRGLKYDYALVTQHPDYAACRALMHGSSMDDVRARCDWHTIVSESKNVVLDDLASLMFDDAYWTSEPEPAVDWWDEM